MDIFFINKNKSMKKYTFRILVLALLGFTLSGCILTKVVTVPMRVVGAVVSIVPVVGNTLDSSLDTTADLIDAFPI
jgi:uncharacterized membrane protein